MIYRNNCREIKIFLPLIIMLASCTIVDTRQFQNTPPYLESHKVTSEGISAGPSQTQPQPLSVVSAPVTETPITHTPAPPSPTPTLPTRRLPLDKFHHHRGDTIILELVSPSACGLVLSTIIPWIL
jgi:hypothetical protein